MQSPLIWPGGKGRLAPRIALEIKSAYSGPVSIIEPFAGSAAVSLALLECGIAGTALINDIDTAVFSFWDAVMNKTDRLLGMAEDTPADVEEYKRQREIYAQAKEPSVELGFALLYLNRTSFSGLLAGSSPRGGWKQEGSARISDRWNKDTVISRIEAAARFKSRVSVSCRDGISLIEGGFGGYRDPFVFADPPYIKTGGRLYRERFDAEGHKRLKDALEGCSSPWVLTYDDCPEAAGMYPNFKKEIIKMNHSARNKGCRTELLILPP